MSQSKVLPVETIIRDADQLPPGKVISALDDPFPIPIEQQSQFCIIRGPLISDILVVSQDVANSNACFALKQKYATFKPGPNFKDFKPRKLEVRQATSEVIRIAYTRAEIGKNNSYGEQTSIEKMITKIVNAAAEAKASDIHIESYVTNAKVFFRVNGSRQLYSEITADEAKSLGVVMYSVHADAGSKDVSWNPADVQDGAFLWNTDNGDPFQFRFSSSPIFPNGGFQIVLRMISMAVTTALPLKILGYTESMLEQVDTMTSASSGMVILCGATNSGKSTSMQAIIRLIYEKRGAMMKIITVEDPVEFVIPSACQISVPRRKTDVTTDPNNTPFTRYLRGTLRQDPDIVMVGEIRDNASASIVKDSVLAGRKLITTLHTYSAFGAFLRLREIGVPWEIMTMPGFISGLIYQRLVPTLCQSCSVPIQKSMETNPELYSRVFLKRLAWVCDWNVHNIRVKGPGCPKCKNTGISGRTVCAEFLLPTRKTLELLAANKILEAEKHWLSIGGQTALMHAIDKMKNGILSPQAIEENISLLSEGRDEQAEEGNHE